MHLIESDDQSAVLLREQIGQQVDLVAQSRLADVRFDGAPVRTRRSEWSERNTDPAQPPTDCLGIDTAQLPGEVLLRDPLDEARGRCLADDRPPQLPGAVLDGIEEDGLPRSAGPGVEGRSTRSAGAVLDRLGDSLDEVVPAYEQRGGDPKGWVEGIGHRLSS